MRSSFPDGAEPPERGGRGPRLLAESSRVEAFSDGVLAIAITLLVLDLHTGGHRGFVGHDLLAQWPTYLAYVASFLYIGVIWVNHHSLFTRIAAVDSGLLWCNLALPGSSRPSSRFSSWSPLTARGLMVATPIFYAATAEGLKVHPAGEGDDDAG